MTGTFHPVSLHVIRGALTFVGFEVGRIRCVSKASEDHQRVLYDVMIAGVRGMVTDRIPPVVIQQAANNAFSSDVLVTRAVWDGRSWSIRLHIGVRNGRDITGDPVDSGDDGELHFDDSPVEVARQ